MITPFTPISQQMAVWFPDERHPYKQLVKEIHNRLDANSAVLDVGCGRTAPNLQQLRSQTQGQLYGIDLVEFRDPPEGLHLFNHDVCHMPSIPDESIDLAYSRAVMEHIERPLEALQEIRRVLKPGGSYVFLTPSFYDYGSIMAHLIPNSLHPKLVQWATGRAEEDVFPTFFRANTGFRLKRLAAETGLEVADLYYLGQYPDYLRFNRVAFWLGSQYQRLLERVPALSPLQGWLLCDLRKPMSG